MLDPRMMPTARLAYVAKKIDGTVIRSKCRWVPNEDKDGKPTKGGQLVREDVKVPAGYMVYFVKGHALRLTEAQMKQYNLRETRGSYVSVQGLVPGDDMMALEDRSLMEARTRDIENMTIRLATRRTGPLLMPEQLTGMVKPPGTEDKEERETA